MMVKRRVLTYTPNNKQLPIHLGVHKDIIKKPFEFQLQLKLTESLPDTDECALWISFTHLISHSPPNNYNDNSVSDLPTLAVVIPSITKDLQQVSDQQQNKKDSYKQTNNSVSINDYEILDTLGEGAYGEVKIAVRKSDPTKVIITKYSLSLNFKILI